MRPLALEADGIFQQELPTEYAAQVAAITGAGKYRITDSISTINLNRDWQTAYHRDANDLPDGWAIIFVAGEYAGGDLIVPRYRLRFELRPGTLLFFKPHEVHGNLAVSGRVASGCVVWPRAYRVVRRAISKFTESAKCGLPFEVDQLRYSGKATEITRCSKTLIEFTSCVYEGSPVTKSSSSR